MNEGLPKAYEAKQYEDSIYQQWEASGFFNPDTPRTHTDRKTDTHGKRLRLSVSSQRMSAFSIAMPPPNVTGNLHIGHAMMLAIEDMLIRYHRMKGERALWVPGFDHAAIATQNVVEKRIWKEEKKTRHDLGREEFLKRVAVFAKDAKTVIRMQIKKMGASCDWSRERYTLDDGLTKAVATMFVRMYEDGLIYRGDRIVNWCPRCQSTLADDEVEYKEQRAKFYYLKYGPVVIGTARPETKFLDKVIIVHPDDARYKKFIGKTFDVEWIEGKVRAEVVADAVADPALGTGAMTITPAHSFEDFALAQKYGFEVHQIIDTQGRMTEAAGSMAGMSAEECRVKVVEHLRQKGLIDRIDENYVHNLSVCYRCDTPIQPLVSKQWFVAVDKKPKSGEKSLKERAIETVRKGKIAIIPDRFSKTYFQWMKNLHDWCISRQIWFGHRIPVWYRTSNATKPPLAPPLSSGGGSAFGGQGGEGGGSRGGEGELYVGVEPPKGEGWEQDPDTLDTWFSSGLWTFSTLGWPGTSPKIPLGPPFKKGEDSPPFPKREGGRDLRGISDLQQFHPTSVMETGYDILFFWVARMIMMTTYALNEVPFKTVYLHGLVRDKFGAKMSKSKPETCIDPLDVIAKYGADAVRLSLIIGGTPGNDVRLYDEKIAGFRNFVNKLWNIGRFVLAQKGSSLRGAKVTKQSYTRDRHASLAMTLADRWILSRLQKVIASVTSDLEHFRFSQAGETLRDFTWGDFADWYLEIKKIEGDPNQLLITNYQLLLKLWHPFTPYVTEVLWRHFCETCNVKCETLLMVAPWPKADKKLMDSEAENAFGLIQEVIAALRNARATYHVPPNAKLTAQIVTDEHGTLFTDEHGIVERLANLSSCTVTEEAERPEDAIPITMRGIVLYLCVGGIVDIAKEQERIKKEIEKQMVYVTGLEKRLSNEEFTKKAPAEIVEAEKAKWDSARGELERLREFLV